MGASKMRWLVTGAAGFIGSNLVEAMLRRGDEVVGLDNFSTGHRSNLAEIERLVGPQAWSNFRFLEGDVRDASACRDALDGVDVVLHQAALGSVPRSIDDPIRSFESNTSGFITLLDEARRAGLRRFVYASSSSVYGDDPRLPKVEDQVGKPLSPYAATKAAGELFAAAFAMSYGIECVGLRYFNVFGPRQDPAGAYAAVIPRWIKALLDGEQVWINGDGETSRDFSYIKNVIEANILAATVERLSTPCPVFNVAIGQRSTLNQLFVLIRDALVRQGIDCGQANPGYRDFRGGDIRHSLADIGRAVRELGYAPSHGLADGIALTVGWHIERMR